MANTINSSSTITGGCLCGAVRYQVHQKPSTVIACHCTQCRRMTGHYMAATFTPKNQIEMVQDEGLKWYRSSDIAQRGFCQQCGSTLFWNGDTWDEMGIAAGTLDDDQGIRLSGHVYVASKGDYYDLDDGLPQYQSDEDVPDG